MLCQHIDCTDTDLVMEHPKPACRQISDVGVGVAITRMES
jgi:hypothetical protein